MKLILATALLLSLLSSTAFATTTASLPSISADEYFERARQKSEQFRHISDELVKLEASGKFDPQNAPEAMKDAEATFLAFKHDLKMASEGGHVVATYLLANIESKFGPTDEERKQFCEPLQKAMGQGLLASAVAYHFQCDIAYMRFDFRSPGHLKYLEDLKQMLQRVDGNRDYYPLPTKRSSCFQDLRAELTAERTLAAIQARSKAMVLTYDQYRAEAYYILAATRLNEKGQPDSQNLAYLNQALALGCKDSMKLKDYYEKEFGAQASK
ncbi:hypothetical protein [Pseudomonas helvetica]|uniref:hypothetical protein n=1 Tax=Pseudomonas helvetica TaxID=3136738 RepID=UPI003265F125